MLAQGAIENTQYDMEKGDTAEFDGQMEGVGSMYYDAFDRDEFYD